MWFVILSVICSVSVGILLKIAKRFQLNIFQIITWNYGVALLFTYFIFKPQLTQITDLYRLNLFNYLDRQL